MTICAVKLYVFLLLSADSVWGLELTINVRRNASVTLLCSSTEALGLCYCPSYPHNCNKCTNVTTLSRPVQISNHNSRVYVGLPGLERRDAGLYVCHRSLSRLGQTYRVNVFDDQNPTVVIGFVGQSIVMSQGTEQEIMAASEKHWCRLANASSCQPNTVLGPENKSRGDFKILNSHSAFSLEKHQLTHSDAGSYRLTLIFHNYTKVFVVQLQVRDKPGSLEIRPVQPKPGERFEIICQYSQDLQDYSKSWWCDYHECPETVKSVDDRFQSALLLTIDEATCSNIKYFQCFAEMPGIIVRSSVYEKPQGQVYSVEMVHGYKSVLVKAYSLLNLICVKQNRYDSPRWSSRYRPIEYDYDQMYWCRVSRSRCVAVRENVKDTVNSLNLQLCVTPKDDGARYRCSSGWWNAEVKLDILAPPPAPPPPPPTVRPKPPTNVTPRSSSGSEHSFSIITTVSSLILLVVVLSVIAATYKSQRLRQRAGQLFTRTTPLSAVDIHANMYANSVAHYYSHQRRQVPPPEKQGEGDDKETSSSSGDEFEELPICPKSSSRVRPQGTDYVMVKPEGAAQSQDDDVIEAGGKKKADQVVRKQRKDAAQSSSEHREDEDEDEVTYTDVIFKPKHRK